ncbi:MAG: BrnA antitoxin family protein [Phyllobacteriaceae bacterium]|nr:BrnA antitoxin family protein [Phyllobacteriaceae bacterium]
MTVSKKSLPRLPENLPPLTDEDGEVRELTPEDMKHFRPTRDVMPEIVESWERARGQRGPQRMPVKERVGLRLDRAVLDHFRASGKGWQTRINDALESYIAEVGKKRG